MSTDEPKKPGGYQAPGGITPGKGYRSPLNRDPAATPPAAPSPAPAKAQPPAPPQPPPAPPRTPATQPPAAKPGAAPAPAPKAAPAPQATATRPAPAAANSGVEAPGSYRGGLFDHLDVPAVTSFLICALLFVLAVVGVKSVDYSSLDKKTLEDIPERIARILMPMKPPGQALPKRAAPRKATGRGAADDGAGSSAADAADASAAARIERSRRTVTEQVAETQQRVEKAAVLSILSGKGPATQGYTAARARRKGSSLVDFGGLEEKLGKLEGLTKFDSKIDSKDGGGKLRDDGVGAQTGIDKMVKGFQNAKMGALSKIGVMELEKPELLERNSRYTGDRSMADVGAFISKKQHMVTMLYEERLKVDPTLEGKITVVLVIEEDGTVSSATVMKSETTLRDPEFQAELLRRIKRWVFPPSTGGPVEMKSPFVFKPA